MSEKETINVWDKEEEEWLNARKDKVNNHIIGPTMLNLVEQLLNANFTLGVNLINIRDSEQSKLSKDYVDGMLFQNTQQRLILQSHHEQLLELFDLALYAVYPEDEDSSEETN